MRVSQAVQWISLQACLLLAPVSAFTPVAVTRGPTESTTALQQQQSRSDSLRTLVASAVLASSLLVGAGAYADELGVEVEAPTMFTGEEIMICKKRGILGACVKSERRTEDNDNDRAKKYFKDPSDIIKEKQAAMLTSDSDEGNLLIEKLRQQTADNKEKNELYVARKTFENDQSATFGPFNRQVVIMNTDGKTYTLLENPQAMRLKKAGFIKNRQFITQPTQEDLEAALPVESEGGGIGGAIQGLFGGSE